MVQYAVTIGASAEIVRVSKYATPEETAQAFIDSVSYRIRSRGDLGVAWRPERSGEVLVFLQGFPERIVATARCLLSSNKGLTHCAGEMK